MWQNIFAVLREDADIEEVSIDSTVIRAHQHAAGAAKKAVSKRSVDLEEASALKSMPALKDLDN